MLTFSVFSPHGTHFAISKMTEWVLFLYCCSLYPIFAIICLPNAACGGKIHIIKTFVSARLCQTAFTESELRWKFRKARGNGVVRRVDSAKRCPSQGQK